MVRDKREGAWCIIGPTIYNMVEKREGRSEIMRDDSRKIMLRGLDFILR